MSHLASEPIKQQRLLVASSLCLSECICALCRSCCCCCLRSRRWCCYCSRLPSNYLSYRAPLALALVATVLSIVSSASFRFRFLLTDDDCRGPAIKFRGYESPIAVAVSVVAAFDVVALVGCYSLLPLILVGRSSGEN